MRDCQKQTQHHFNSLLRIHRCFLSKWQQCVLNTVSASQNRLYPTAVMWRDSWIHQIILDLQLHWWKWEFGTWILKPFYLYYGKLLTLFHYFWSCLGSYAIILGRILAVFPAVIPNDLISFWWDKYNKLNNGAKNIYRAQKGTFPSTLHSIAQQA